MKVITNIFVKRLVRTKVQKIEALFTEAKDKLVEILVHPDSTNEQIAEAVSCIRSLDKGIKDIKTKVRVAINEKI
jgi:archaellum component FlaC